MKADITRVCLPVIGGVVWLSVDVSLLYGKNCQEIVAKEVYSPRTIEQFHCSPAPRTRPRIQKSESNRYILEEHT